ncbi:EF-P beta-lysylation protein EpmB [Pseudomaricurvus sp. HS19]|uniref:EF-P beta-lysylation protein EpmB n=1 Tax=Pseudomaricurvus sp. HS19 TaxID=2692626 RepID=UPI0013682152|nr:EF-P beta-lysylation protein EpmB [Pseudomaricurvus sp. HS19]MYM64256.1 EF-P beta-lysylation protein EpmB [Pseudomaricurvus sp. HS19]
MSQIIPAQTTLSWQEAMIQAVREPRQLLEYLQLPMELLPAAEAATSHFGLRVPKPFLERIRKGDLNDPLLRQILPLEAELHSADGYSADPLQELGSNPQQGLIHKYRGRALLVVAPHCAVNCRYCFRRHFPYADNNPGRAQWQATLDYLREDDSLQEVIFSGGDPMASGDRQLQWLVEQLCQIPHLQRLRVHTRLPVVIPQRITDDALRWLSGHRLQTVLVIHSNHANELDPAVGDALARLRHAGVTLLNQAVLLRGVNDTLASQKSLSERLFQLGVLPYYLHQLDRVDGAAHFEVSDTEALELHRQMQACMSGYLVPKLAREEPGQPNKTLLY